MRFWDCSSFLSPLPTPTEPQGSLSWCFSSNLIHVLKQVPLFATLRKCFDPIPVIPNIIPLIWSVYCPGGACTHRGRKNAVFDGTAEVNFCHVLCAPRLGYCEGNCWQGLIAIEWPAHPKLSPGWAVWSLFLRFIWDKILCFYRSIFKCLWCSYASSNVSLELLSGVLTFFKERTDIFQEGGQRRNEISCLSFVFNQ